MQPRRGLGGLVAVTFAALTLAAPVVAQDGTVRDFTMRAVRTDTPPVIDGVPEDDEWRNAATVQDFLQYQPTRGNPSEFVTIVRLLYDDTR